MEASLSGLQQKRVAERDPAGPLARHAAEREAGVLSRVDAAQLY